MATINGTSGNDTLFGTSVSDTINGLGGDDTLWGYGGNDRLDGGTGADTMYGGIGNDIYTVDNVGDSAIENDLEGTDQIKTSLTSYTLPAYVEKLLFTGSGSFTGTGNIENNEIMGGGSGDTLSGADGVDVLWGGNGNDTLNGGAGDDVLLGESGSDTMSGNGGDDTYMIDSGDTIVEQPGEGTDFIYSNIATYTLPDNFEDLRYNLWTGSFTGTGNALNNKIIGGSNNDTLSGLDGNDELDGGTGADILYGGDGDDVLIGGGGTGADTMTGGASSDTFKIGYYESGTGSAADKITDFESGVDLIDVSGWDADITQPDNQDFIFVDDAPFDGTPGLLRAEFDGVDTIVVQGDIDGDMLADFEIRLENVFFVSGSDFLV